MAARFLFLCLISLMMTGCLSVVTTSATQTAYLGAQERSMSDASEDTRLRMLISDKLFKYNVDLFRDVTLTIVEGRVLLTGNVRSLAMRMKATELVWEVQGVKQVINELEVRTDTGLGNYTRDSWIIAKIRTQLIWADRVISINYNIDSMNGVVYLTGIAQDQDELDRVIAIAGTTDGVRRVVSYVRLKTDLPNPLIPARPEE